MFVPLTLFWTALAGPNPSFQTQVHARVTDVRVQVAVREAELAAWNKQMENGDPMAIALALNDADLTAHVRLVTNADEALREVSLVYGDKMPEKKRAVSRAKAERGALDRRLALALQSREIELAVLKDIATSLEKAR